MSKYSRLSISEREEISIGLGKGLSKRDIAQLIVRHPSTVGREIKRSEVDGCQYRAVYAQKIATKLLHIPRKPRKLDQNQKLKDIVHKFLELKWSPAQIAKRLKMLYPVDMNMQISHESIYSYLYVLPRGRLREDLVRCLRRAHIHRRKRKTLRRSCPIQDYISIEERPAEVADRIIPGHWEGDLIMGHNNGSAMGTLVERTTRMTFLVKLKEKDTVSVRIAFGKEFKRLPKELKRSLTYDHGQEMAEHKLFTKDTNIQVYFAHPHSPWERGTNENTNDLVRQFFPKGTDFSKVTLRETKKVQELLNNRPRKVLEFFTPNEVFSELLR